MLLRLLVISVISLTLILGGDVQPSQRKKKAVITSLHAKWSQTPFLAETRGYTEQIDVSRSPYVTSSPGGHAYYAEKCVYLRV
ncbi:unnamed protein product [Anisakis simplex]|uniref:Secreted protein n=1 Tax=Anisakis simplex TaxID=6269 RepID=A0A0M3J5B6_ANISI|nr:unnamed protein product [Anisakis simplex]